MDNDDEQELPPPANPGLATDQNKNSGGQHRIFDLQAWFSCAMDQLGDVDVAKSMDKAVKNISGVFHFEFSAARPGVVRLNATSSSDPVDINLRCNDDDPAPNLGADLNMDGLLLEAKALSEVPFIHNDMRDGYLAAHIANKYKGSEGEFLTEFLSDGTTQQPI
ncbi:uncharacterized protein MONBRDRAFT_12829 [Monosiga brevicollis MX1]|uniref:Uncharacterized protein n=1 Tax=Monosiga brevicollis TaxID=81824 RepID=A9VDG0_MONBE|nr:uncharacterized protein MONBRDRAFT_12829 [Monosiga brevicollis MX1]EDQ84468.1 predicted protein [Monosiga brevicollis MX1]|eukprot:XP_001750763.1 hypothetical protein [Monosiga brevicollis MX1]